MPNLKQIGTILGATALVGLAGGGIGYAAVEVPDAQEVAVQTAGAPQAIIDDSQGVLSPADRERLLSDTSRIDAPSVVTDLHYMVFQTNHQNIMDDVEGLLRSEYPDLIDQSKGENGRPRDGVLIVGVGLDPRRGFIYGGDDVTSELALDDDGHVQDLLDAMKPGVRDGNIPAGLFRTANQAMDADAIAQHKVDAAEDSRVGAAMGLGLGGAAVGFGGSAVAVAVRDRRRKAIAQAREDYDLVTGEYTRLAGRLDEVDVRANSLSSAFADETLRRQWAEVRDRFLSLNDVVSGAGGLSSINMGDDGVVYKHRKQLADAAEAVEHTSNAEDNIDRLFAVEHGDAARGPDHHPHRRLPRAQRGEGPGAARGARRPAAPDRGARCEPDLPHVRGRLHAHARRLPRHPRGGEEEAVQRREGARKAHGAGGVRLRLLVHGVRAVRPPVHVARLKRAGSTGGVLGRREFLGVLFRVQRGRRQLEFLSVRSGSTQVTFITFCVSTFH